MQDKNVIVFKRVVYDDIELDLLFYLFIYFFVCRYGFMYIV